MAEQLLSVGIDIGTSTTQLVISRLTLENRANPFSVPRVAIAGREVLYRSGIHFTPLLSDTVIDAQGVRAIVEEEYRKSGFNKGEIATGAVIITGETARKRNTQTFYTLISAEAPPTCPSGPTGSWYRPAAWMWAGGSSRSTGGRGGSPTCRRC